MNTSTTHDELRWFLRSARAPRLRTMREFAEQELFLPDGPSAGLRFRCDRQPYTRLFLDLLDDPRWNRFVATGPVQTGKSWIALVVPTLYHLFEMQETVCFGVPRQEMAADKWQLDLLPAIRKSRYADLLPDVGAGAKGGTPESIQFKHGPTLKFLGGGGSDKKRAGFTSRVLVVTETDGMDEAGGTSREADKITQMEGRTQAYGERKRVYLECSVSIEEGRIWREYTRGTASQILLPCPYCADLVSPEREHLQGWQAAESVVAAKRLGHFVCPTCSRPWTEEDRRAANERAQVLHRGQRVEGKQVVGEPAETDTLGFRWSHVNNLFLTAGYAAAKEWTAAREQDEENARKELLQFVWALPYRAQGDERSKIDADALSRRVCDVARGVPPDDVEFITVGADVGKHLLHWVVIGWRLRGPSVVLDYGRIDVPSDALPLDRAIAVALRMLRDEIIQNRRWQPRAVWVDSGYQPAPVSLVCRESDGETTAWLPLIGCGGSEEKPYTRPRALSATIRKIGDGYHVARLPKRGSTVELDSCFWKGWLHSRLSIPSAQPGAIVLFAGTGRDHLAFSKHIAAEEEQESFLPGRGKTRSWKVKSKNNHWLDAGAYSCAAAADCGFVLPGEGDASTPPAVDTSWSRRAKRVDRRR